MAFRNNRSRNTLRLSYDGVPIDKFSRVDEWGLQERNVLHGMFYGDEFTLTVHIDRAGHQAVTELFKFDRYTTSAEVLEWASFKLDSRTLMSPTSVVPALPSKMLVSLVSLLVACVSPRTRCRMSVNTAIDLKLT